MINLNIFYSTILNELLTFTQQYPFIVEYLYVKLCSQLVMQSLVDLDPLKHKLFKNQLKSNLRSPAKI